MREFWRKFGCVFGVALILMASPSAVFAQDFSGAQNIKISATVAPHTFLIVDDSGKLKQVINNSDSEASLVALHGNLFGQTQPIDQNILDQYYQLKPSLNFHYGTVYRQPGLLVKAIKGASFKSVMFRSMKLFGL